MLKKELPLKHIKINYDPIIDTPLEIIAQYPDLYEQKIAENGIDTIIYDNDISEFTIRSSPIFHQQYDRLYYSVVRKVLLCSIFM